MQKTNTIVNVQNAFKNKTCNTTVIISHTSKVIVNCNIFDTFIHVHHNNT